MVRETTKASAGQRPLLAKLYLALYLRESARGHVADARCYLAEALRCYRALDGWLEELIPDWAMRQRYGRPAALAEAVLSNLAGDLAIGPGGLRRRVLGRIHIAEAFVQHRRGHAREVRQHVWRGLRYDPSALRNRGVLSILARSFLGRPVTEPCSPQRRGAQPGEVPGTLLDRVRITIGADIDRVERLFGGTSRDESYLLEAGGQEYVLHILDAGRQALDHLLAIAEPVRTAGVPVPAILASSLAGPEGEQDTCWLLEEKVTGSWFDPLVLPWPEQLAVVADLARCLRRLHGIHVAGFGWIRSAPLQATYATSAEWLDHLHAVFARGVEAGTIPESAFAVLDAADCYLRLTYAGSPVLCHSDLSEGNIIVSGGRVRALIDWSNAEGNDPASDLGSLLAHRALLWRPKEEHQVLATLIEAYGGDDALRARVGAHRLLCIAQLLSWCPHLFSQEERARLASEISEASCSVSETLGRGHSG